MRSEQNGETGPTDYFFCLYPWQIADKLSSGKGQDAGFNLLEENDNDKKRCW
jgi:hypothetical protein